MASGQEIRRFKGYEGPNTLWDYVGFSPDGKSLVTNDDNGNIILWDVASGREIRRFVGQSAAALSFRFSGDGQRGLSGSDDGSIVLWDTTTGSMLHRFTYSSPVPQVDISADGRYGIGGSPPSLLDLNTGEAIRLYTAPSFSFSFAPDGRTAIMAAYPDQIELWRIDTTLDELLTWTHANRYIADLTCDQRTLYQLEPLCDPNQTATSIGSK